MAKSLRCEYVTTMVLLGLCCCTTSVRGEEPMGPVEKLAEKPLIELPAILLKDLPSGETRATPRVALPGMPAGFLVTPLGLEDDDFGKSKLDEDDPLPGILMQVGNDNPYFDRRWPGQPGGPGYYRVHSQMQMFDLGSTSMCLGLDAWTPAGLQWGGLGNGPTLVKPAFAWFHDLGEGAALQGYVGQNIQANSRWSDSLSDNLEYGMAVQCPCPGLCSPGQGVYFFFQALGRYHEGNNSDRSTTWQMIPGIHWRLTDSFWMSLGAARRGLLTCSWQF